jgi:hypothetical protein
MIDASGWVALYIAESPGTVLREMRVVCWGEEGDELVGYVHDDMEITRVVKATSIPGFQGYRGRRVVGVVPGQGFQARFSDLDRPDSGTVEYAPVVAWLLYDDGHGSAVAAGELGGCELVTASATFDRVVAPQGDDRRPQSSWW